MTDEEFTKLVEAGIAELRSDIRAKLDAVAIVIEDEPTAEQLVDLGCTADDRIFGLYEGVPLTERGLLDEVILPDKITIFKNAILATYTKPEDIQACVANTVWHEVAHYFGMDEEMVTEEEKRRGKEL